jgi:hypothetical protein
MGKRGPKFKPNAVTHSTDGTTVIHLYRKGVHHECLIDTSDYPLVASLRWRAYKDSACADLFYADAQHWQGGRRVWIRMHRLLVPNVPSVDHIDHNGLNNRRSNLRPANACQQRANQRKRSGTSSKYLGVQPSGSRRRPFRATIHSGKKRTNLCLFNSEAQAALAYDSAAIELHGEFARLNFPPEREAA